MGEFWRRVGIGAAVAALIWVLWNKPAPRHAPASVAASPLGLPP